MSQTLRRRADPKRKMDWFCVFCYGDEESEHRAGTNGHLTTANHTGMYIPGIVWQYHNARGRTKIA